MGFGNHSKPADMAHSSLGGEWAGDSHRLRLVALERMGGWAAIAITC